MKNLLAKLSQTDSQGDSAQNQNDDLIKSIEQEWYEKEGNVLAQKVIDTFKEEKDLLILLRNRMTYDVSESVKLKPEDPVKEQLRVLLMQDYVTSCKAFNELNLTEKNAHKTQEEKEKSEHEAWRNVLDQLLDRYYTENKKGNNADSLWSGKGLLDNVSMGLAKFVLFIEKQTGVDRRTVFVVLIVVFAFVAFRMVVANLLRVITDSYLEPNTAASAGLSTAAAQTAIKMATSSSTADVDQEFEF